ncbi:HxsD-like protein [Patescibacteria group bacterium]|nr:HxsD-like protein [Patescibacteria group bacterium]
MIVKFSKIIYYKKSIIEAIRKYRHLADFSLKTTPDYITVSIKNIDKDLNDILKDEFCNYVLYLMKK